MMSISAALAERCCSGVSRNHQYQAMHQSAPRIPNSKKGHRHPWCLIRKKTTGALPAAPTANPMNETLSARPCCDGGNQREIVRVVLGTAPASPAPNRNRMMIREAKPAVTPVNAVNIDHHSTIRVSAFLVPI